MKMEQMTIEVEGVTPLLIHNGRTSNPLDPYSKRMKEVTSKRNKTEEDYERLMSIQWEAGLYWNDKIGLYMPGENLYAAFMAGAKKHKLGPKSSAVTFLDIPGCAIITENHMSLEGLKAEPKNKFIKTVTCQRNKTLSCRPIFQEWSMEFTLEFDAEIIDANEVKTILTTMQSRIGFGVWRPNSPKPGTYGKFLVKALKYIDHRGEEREITTGF